MHGKFDNQPLGSSMLFAYNLNVQEYLNSLPMEVLQEVTKRQLRYNEINEDVKTHIEETEIEP